MQISEAIDLIQGINIDQSKVSIWADLGCGGGTFTLALAQLLTDQSVIYAIDKDSQHIKAQKDIYVDIQFLQTDFETEVLNLPSLDGVLMANALHYVADKKVFLKRVLQLIKPGGKLLFVEYDTLKANPWVPYPINFMRMDSLLRELGIQQICKLGERSSIYGRANIYACSGVVN